MTKKKTAVVVLAAGLGTRMKSKRPKVMHPIAGRPMIRHLLATVAELRPERTVVVLGRNMDEAARAVAPLPIAVQHPARGTADAVRAATSALAGFEGDVLVVFAADPLVRAGTLKSMLAALRRPASPAVVV
ncbi:MAG: bifunctional UDP-N-acetylglucosamine diphosphorylase/glucosamine-1-phosphate N-acetyltransferase GlmU, partial [Alphaproteobacteria bacterium]|nr:bifunctional UDP-N-acetylglucosamine diphosphorylase/glucosamine-1-phosphate N-acetyltransferase GlmU [Alphaproteobacteria bacterium]